MSRRQRVIREVVSPGDTLPEEAEVIGSTRSGHKRRIVWYTVPVREVDVDG